MDPYLLNVPLDPRCEIVRNGDQFVCLKHHRHWQTGICPGLQGSSLPVDIQEGLRLLRDKLDAREARR